MRTTSTPLLGLFLLLAFLALARAAGPASSRCPDIHFTAKAPLVESLASWEEDDWDAVCEFKYLSNSDHPSVADYGYIFNSSLVYPPSPYNYYREDYDFAKWRSDFIAPSVAGESPGVPGTWDYNEDYSQWRGSGAPLGAGYGPCRYHLIISAFGHEHILFIQWKINTHRLAPCLEDVQMDRQLTHMIEGSTQIFAKYGELVDGDGNQIDFSNDHPYVVAIKNMMRTFIYGDNTLTNAHYTGIVDTDALFDQFTWFVENVATPAHPNYAVLNAELGRLGQYLHQVLHAGTPCPLPLLAWYPLMVDHQNHTYSMFERYRELYRTNKNHPSYAELQEHADASFIHALHHGNQMAAFFGVFEIITNILDKFMYTANDNEYAIPFAVMNDRVNGILEENFWFWKEHVSHFVDYDKAAALDDVNAMYEIQRNMLESCSHLAGAVLQTFVMVFLIIAVLRRRHRSAVHAREDTSQ